MDAHALPLQLGTLCIIPQPRRLGDARAQQSRVELAVALRQLPQLPDGLLARCQGRLCRERISVAVQVLGWQRGRRCVARY